MYHTGGGLNFRGSCKMVKYWRSYHLLEGGVDRCLNGVGPFSVGFYMHRHLVFINGIILKARLWTVITLKGLHLGIKICLVFKSISPLCCRFTQSFGTRAFLEKICNPRMETFCIGMVKIFALYSEIPHDVVTESDYWPLPEWWRWELLC